MRRLLLVFVVLGVSVAHAGDDVKPRWVGAWTGKVTAKGCATDGKSTLALDVTVSRESTLRSNGDLLVEGLGDLDWTADGKNLAIKRDGLTATLKASGKSAKLVVKTDGGCAIKGTLKRVSSGIPPCDQAHALSTIKAQCTGGSMETVDADWKAWARLKGKKKKAQAAACKEQIDTLTIEVDACVGRMSSTGLPDCDNMIAMYNVLSQCQTIPQASRDAMMQGLEAMKQGWGDPSQMDDETRKMINDSCKQASDAVKQVTSSMGC